MTKKEALALEDMTNKIVEYIWAISSDKDDSEVILLGVASKFIMASLCDLGSYNAVVVDDEIISRVAIVADMIMSNGGEYYWEEKH